MRILLASVIFFICAFVACKQKTPAEKALDDSQKFLDSLTTARQVDSMVEESMASIHWDTVGVSEAPVQIITAKLVKREYSNYKDMYLKFKNVSGKDISAIRFAWYGVTAFGEPADMGGLLPRGFGGGFDDSGLKAGKTGSGQWSILSSSGKKVIKAWPTEIAFEDGSKWKSTSR